MSPAPSASQPSNASLTSPTGGNYGYGYGPAPTKYVQARTFQDYLNLFRRHLWIVIITTVIGLLISLYVFSITPKVHKAWATIEVEKVNREKTDLDVANQVRLSASQEILATIEKLQLPKLYQGVARSDLFLNRKNVLPKAPELPIQLPWMKPEVEENPDGTLPPNLLAQVMEKWVVARWREDTNLVDVYAWHTDPQIAQDILEGLLEEYEKLSEASVDADETYALEFIERKVAGVKETMMGTEATLSRYVRCLRLAEEIREAEGLVIQMEKRYLDKWPPLVEARELVNILRDRFSQELEKVLVGAPDEAKFWEEETATWGSLAGEDLVEAQLKLVESRASLLNKSLESDQRVFDQFMTMLKAGQTTQDYTSKQFAVVQPPMISTDVQDIRPQKRPMVLKGVLGGGAAGVAIVFLLGFVDRSMRTVAEIETGTGLPVVGAIPITKIRQKGERQELALEGTKDALAAEAVRTLRAGLVYLGDQEERTTFVISSALPSEGKSWVAANLSAGFAGQGDRTLLIDADLRKPVQWKTFGIHPDHPGLTDVLVNKCSIAEGAIETEIENLWVMSAGSRSPNPAELLGSKNLPGLVTSVARQFDRVIIDSAPLIPVADTLSISKLVQSVLLVYRVGMTPRGALIRALKTLRANGSEPIGIIANRLPRPRSKGSHGYYYGYHGGGQYSDYYTGYGSSGKEA